MVWHVEVEYVDTDSGIVHKQRWLTSLSYSCCMMDRLVEMNQEKWKRWPDSPVVCLARCPELKLLAGKPELSPH